MKKGYIWIIIIIVLVGVGVFFYKEEETKSKAMEKDLRQAAEEYFTNNVSTNSKLNGYKVTLDQLNKEDYKLDSLKECDKKETYAYIVINMYNGTVKRTDVKLNCPGLFLLKK